MIFEIDDDNIEFFKFIGITYELGMDVPVFEDSYIKFMSDKGELDEMQANQFEAWLVSQGASYERISERSFNHIDDFIVEKMNTKIDELFPE